MRPRDDKALPPPPISGKFMQDYPDVALWLLDSFRRQGSSLVMPSDQLEALLAQIDRPFPKPFEMPEQELPDTQNLGGIQAVLDELAAKLESQPPSIDALAILRALNDLSEQVASIPLANQQRTQQMTPEDVQALIDAAMPSTRLGDDAGNLIEAYDIAGKLARLESLVAELQGEQGPTSNDGVVVHRMWNEAVNGTKTFGNSIVSTLGSIVTSQPAFTATQTWNDVSVTFKANFLNVTDTNSAALSLLADWQVGGTPKFQVTKAGNVAFAATSAAIGTSYRAVQVSNFTLMAGTSGSTAELEANMFFDGSNYKYINSSYAALFGMTNGAFAWYTAPSGTAGNTVTITQYMGLSNTGVLALQGTLDASAIGTANFVNAGGMSCAKAFFLGGLLNIADAKNVVLGSTTGTIFGTAITQKMGFYNAAPIAQRAGAAQAAVATTGATNLTPYGYTTAAQADAIVTLVNELRAWAVAQGFIKGAA